MVFFLFFGFFWSNRRDGRAISRRGCLFRLVEVVGVAARGICGFIHIYIVQILSDILWKHTQTRAGMV